MSIKYIEIKHSFLENTYQNHKTADINEFVDLISKNDDSYSIFEIINNYSYNKMYFDIENIPIDKDELIFEIVNELILHLNDYFKFKSFDVKDIEYIITENNNSRTHDGRSYHVIFSNVVSVMYHIVNYLKYYIGSKFTGYEYIDMAVYSSNRLFRSYNQPGVNKKGSDLPLYSDDKHNIIYPKRVNKDIITKSVITYTENIENIFRCDYPKMTRNNLKTINKEYKRLQRNKFSNEFKTVGNKQIFIFNQPMSKEDIDEFINRKEQIKKDGKEEYDKAIILLELIKDNEDNKKMINLLKEIKQYYDTNNNFTDFRLTIEQIAGIEKIIESKI